jgi:hypothetical protein
MSSSALLESTLGLGTHTDLYARVEQVQKNGDDLGFIGGDLIQLFTIRSLSLGFTRDVRSVGDVQVSLGARASLNLVPSTLRLVYGTTTTAGLAIFARVRPGR